MERNRFLQLSVESIYESLSVYCEGTQAFTETIKKALAVQVAEDLWEKLNSPGNGDPELR